MVIRQSNLEIEVEYFSKAEKRMESFTIDVKLLYTLFRALQSSALYTLMLLHIII